jgi:hypothetical protein
MSNAAGKNLRQAANAPKSASPGRGFVFFGGLYNTIVFIYND